MLLHQFASLLQERGISASEITVATGRDEKNCAHYSTIRAAVALGENPASLCHKCRESTRCVYTRNKERLNSRDFRIALTTHHYLLYNTPPDVIHGNGWPDTVVVFDEMPPFIMEVQFAARFACRAYLHLGKQRKTLACPAFFPGETTYVLSATPVPAFLEHMFNIPVSCFKQDVAIEQTVYQYLLHLTMSSTWKAPHACGFKKNTTPGMPYFMASIGLGDWRGRNLQVAGTFAFPPGHYAITASFLSALSGEHYTVDWIPILYEFTNRRLPGAVLGYRNHRVIAMASVSPSLELVQLLGRSGVLTTDRPQLVYSDLPLNFSFPENGVESAITLAREVVLCDRGEKDLQCYHLLRYLIASGERNIASVVQRAGMDYDCSLVRHLKQIPERINQEVETLVPQVKIPQREEVSNDDNTG